MSENLEPGPELNRLIAEKVMGWPVVDPPVPKDLSWPRYIAPCYLRRSRATPAERWAPSEDISAAWEVVEKLLKLGCAIDLAAQIDSDWICDLLRRGPCSYCASGGTAQLAICRAALKMIEARDLVSDATR